MPNIVAFSGSLRRGSYNASLLRAAAAAAPTGAIEIASIREIPLYDGDVEAAGIPEPVRALKDKIAQCQGLLIVTPEYNNSIPGVTKNVIDWLSRPPADTARVFRDLPVAIMGASPGRYGTILSQNAWLPVLRTLQTRPWFGGRLQVGEAAKVFDADGKIVDARVQSELEKFVQGFVEFAKANERKHA